MCVKDMPSVALGCTYKSATDQMNLDLVLDGMVDDRIEAAYAIVELGGGAPRKGVEFPLAEEETLDLDETEQYHQVPRSPECLRECRRGACNRSADASPVRDTVKKPLECHLPKIVHVKGAVMPSRAIGNPVQKLTLKRRHDDEAVSSGIKAKLARMLNERKFSHEETGKTSPDDEICKKNGDANDSDEEQNTVVSRGRFVRTSAPVFQPANIISHIQSAANCTNFFGNLAVKTEQSFSTEKINKLHSLIPKSLINEQVAFPDQGSSSQGLFEEVSNFKLNEALKDYKACSSEVSSNDVNAPSSLYCSPDYSVSTNGTDTVLSEHLSATGKSVSAIMSDREAQTTRDERCFLLGSANNSTSASGAGGLLHYYMLPMIKSLPNSINPEFFGIRPSVESNVVDALKQLEQFSLGNGYRSGQVLKGDLVVPESQQSSWNLERYRQLYGSSNCISGQSVKSNSPVSEARNPLFGLFETLSLQNLSGSGRVSPKLASSHKQHQSLKHDIVVNESKKTQIIEDVPIRRTMPKIELNVTKPSRKISAIVEALEMVKGGEFGSLSTIRNLYNSMNSRNFADSSAYFLQSTQLKTEYRSLGFGEHEQELPLDLSRYRRRMSSYQPSELKVEAKPCPSYPPSFETFPPADLCRNENCDSYSKADVNNDVMPSDILPVKAYAAVVSPVSDSSATRLADDKSNRDSNELFALPSSRSVPNSHLPPKKRKFLPTSQHCDFSESETSSCTKPTLPYHGSPTELRSYTHQISANGCSDQTLEAQSYGRTISEPDTRLLPDLIANEESVLSAVAVRDEDGDLPLHITVAQGSVDIVQKLLRVMSTVGVSVDSCNNNRQTALHLAVISNQTQMVELLLNASASANVCDRKGNTAIHLAVKYKTLSCLKKILEDSRIPLNLDARNYEGLTALHIGVQLSQPDAVQALLIGGANPNTTDGTNGRTPLFNAVEANDFIIVSTLIQHGSDPYIANYSGCMPLQIATGKSLREMVGILEKSGKEWTRRIQDSN